MTIETSFFGADDWVTTDTHYNYVPLLGTAKQIAWAAQIRSSAIASEYNKIESLGFISADKVAQLPKAKQEIAKRLLTAAKTAQQKLYTETSAMWWIDNRTKTNEYVSYMFAKAKKEISAEMRAK